MRPPVLVRAILNISSKQEGRRRPRESLFSESLVSPLQGGSSTPTMSRGHRPQEPSPRSPPPSFLIHSFIQGPPIPGDFISVSSSLVPHSFIHPGSTDPRSLHLGLLLPRASFIHSFIQGPPTPGAFASVSSSLVSCSFIHPWVYSLMHSTNIICKS